MLAVIKTGGKQYKVAPGQKIKIEKIDGDQGKEAVFDQVLLVEKNKKIKLGNPTVKGAKVEGKILRQAKAKKVIAFKFHNKTRYKRKKGHRQPFTEVEIKKIEIGE